MSILSRLASATGDKAQTANTAAAKYIADRDDTHALGELIHHLEDKRKELRYDCIKTLYEVAYLKPQLVAEYAETFVILLQHKDNRMQWGAMTLLSALVPLRGELLFRHLNEIIETARKGSVITMDHCINILASLSSKKDYQPVTFPALLSLLSSAPDNQAPSYAEKIAAVIIPSFKPEMIEILEGRVQNIVPESKQKRVAKVIWQLKK